MSTNDILSYSGTLAPAFGLSAQQGIPGFGSTGLPVGPTMTDTLSRGTRHANLLDQLDPAQGMPASAAMSRPVTNGLPTSLGLNTPQASIPYAASAGNHNNLPSLNNQFFVNQAGQPLRANDLAMLQLQQQLQGLSVMTPAATNAGFANQTRCDPYTNQVASAQAFARLQQQQQQQTQLLAAQLQAATAGSNLSTLQINALRQTLAAKQQAAMPAGQPKAMAVIAEASRIAALRAQQQQLAQSLQGGPPSGLHAATIQSLLAQGHGAQQQPPASVHHHSQPAQQHVQDSHFKDKLVEMGVGLAQNNITIETAVNAGLLGGLSASDVRILAAAHRAEARRQELARHGTYGGISQALPPQSMARFPPPPAAPNKMMMSHNTFMPSSTNNNVVGHAEPQALFDASKLGTSLFGGSVASGAASDTPSALQQKGFFSFFGNDDTDEQPVQDDDDDAKSSADNTTDGSHVTSTTNTEPIHGAAADAAFLCQPNVGQSVTLQDPPFSSSFDYSLQAAVQRTIPAVPATHQT